MTYSRFCAWTFALALALVFGKAQAQSASSAPSQPYTLQATTLERGNFDIGQIKGKVVMVFFWSTNCAVCRSHLPELRANMAGWRNKPFALVTVNVDSKFADWLAYENIAIKTQAVRPISVWTGSDATQKLPLTLVLDTSGRVVLRLEGRIAPEAWDSVAELLP
ncbi:MAG: hypothetical protein RLZZ573_258 [Pseudomonadota bacterium]|jgi:thiol-disulfide isomerase/thioredoxin